MRKIEVPTDSPTKIELGDTAGDIQRREEEEKQQREDRGEARRVDTPKEETSQTEKEVAEK